MATMHHFNVRVGVFLGLGLLLGGLALILGAERSVYAQGNNQPPEEYVGASQCATCHKDLARYHGTSRHALALQDASSDKSVIKADFTTGEKERTVAFPDDSTARPFTADDIAYVVGSGRYVERYLYKVSRNKYAVFPAEWNVEKKAWQPYLRGGGADKWAQEPAYDWATNCAGCHTTGLLVNRGRWTDDGVQCEACHGPGSNHVDLANKAGSDPGEDDLKALHAAIVLTPDSQVCGQCHSQGTEPAKNLPFPTTYLPGTNLLDAQVFTLVAPDDKDHWWVTGHAKQQNMQFNEWLKSGHSKSLQTMQGSKDAAPACLECHSGDFPLNSRLAALQKAGDLKPLALDPLTVTSAKYGVGCVNCHEPHGGENPVAFDLAKPDAYTLCTSCHRATDVTKSLHHPVQDMFEGRVIIKSIPGIPSDHFKNAKGPRCITCHMPDVPVDTTSNPSHTFQLVQPGKTSGQLPDSCSGCHNKLTPTDLQSLIDGTQDTVRARLSVAFVRLATVPKPDAGSTVADQYSQVVTALAFVQNDGSLGVHNYAYTDALLKAAERSLSELGVPGSAIKPTEGPAPTATLSGSPVPSNPPGVSVPTGYRPSTVLSLCCVSLILLIGAVAFFRKAGR